MNLLDAAYYELSVERRELRKKMKEMKDDPELHDEFDYIGQRVYDLAMELQKINSLIK